MLGLYILNDNGDPVPETDTLKWSEWFEKFDRHIAMTPLGRTVRVSTVFLGIDHNFSPMRNPLNYKPVLWETMVFNGKHDQYQARYSSKEEALQGHNGIVAKIEEEMKALIAVPMRERYKLRPENYATLSPEEQWEVDKSLEILDWDGSTAVELAAVRVRGRLFREE